MASTIQFDPYHKWLGIPPEEQPPHHYRLLGIRLYEADIDVIQSAADQRMAHVRTFQTGAHAEASQKILNELAAARICLLKPDRKSAYDAELKRRLKPDQPAPPPVPQPVAPVPKAKRIAAAAPAIPMPTASAQPMAVPIAAPSPQGEVADDFSFEPSSSHHRPRSRKQSSSAAVIAVVAVVVMLLGGVGVYIAQKTGRPPIKEKQVAGPTKIPSGPSSDSSPNVAPQKTTPPKPEPEPTEPEAALEPPTRPLRQMPSAIDDSDSSGFSREGAGWRLITAEGISYKNTHAEHQAGAGEAVATWTFDGLEKGTRYRIFASWHDAEDHAGNARYLITGGATGGSTVEVDQRSAPRADATFNRQRFQELTTLKCATGTLTIRLRNDADNKIVADAMLLVPDLRPETQVASSNNPTPRPRPTKPALPEMPPDDGKPTVVRPDDPTWLAQFTKPVTGIAVLADEPRALVTSLDPDNPASYWDLDEHIERRRIDRQQMPYLCATVVPGQKLFFLGAESGRLTVWDLRDDAQSMVYMLAPHMGPISALFALADGKTLAIGGEDKVLLVRYNVSVEQRWANYDILAEWTGFNAPITALAVSSDAKRIIAGCGGSFPGTAPESSDDMKLHGFDVPSRDTKDFPGHHGSVWSMALSDDGKRLATASSDGKVRLWDTKLAKMIEEMPGHEGAVLAVAISGDGNTIVSGGEDATVRIWDARTGRATNIIRGHNSPIRTLALSTIGKYVVSGSQNGELRLFNMLSDSSGTGSPLVEDRKAPPAEAARAEALKLVQEVFASDFQKADTPTKKIALADVLLGQAVKSRDDAERYVLVDEARKLAVTAGDFTRALSAVRDQAERFEIDRWIQTCAIIEESSKTVTTNSLRKQLSEAALDQAERAIIEDRYDEAKQMLATVLPIARKANDAALVRQITSRGKEVVELAKAYESVRKAAETLEDAADDPAANLILGRHLCFVRMNWSQGLPHLAKGEDATLAGLANRDLKLPDTSEDQIAVADAWWELAGAAEPVPKKAMLLRAEFWYRAALPQLTGLAKAKADKRLEEIAALVEGQDSGGDDGHNDAGAVRALATRLRNAVKSNNLVRTAIHGQKNPRYLFTEVPLAGLLVQGFDYSIDDVGRIGSIRAMYSAAKGNFAGAIHGDPTRGRAGKVEAPKGYAVGGLEVYGLQSVSGFIVIFMKVTKTGLDPNDVKRSDMIGSNEFGGEAETLGGDGQPVVGIFGTARLNGMLEGIGLIQVAR